MKKLHMAWLEFWNSFTWNEKPVKAYPKGRVPANEPFPYFTFEVAKGDYFSTGILTAHIWCRMPGDNSYNVQAQRAEILDAVAAKIPPRSGCMLTYNGGGVLIRRNESSFQSYYDPKEEDNISNPTGEPVIGGRISLMVQYFAR